MMTWEERMKERYHSEGASAFEDARRSFGRVLQVFCEKKGISIVDDNPEGKDWIILLRDGTELYVEWRSYETGNSNTDFWVEYMPERGGIVADFTETSDQLHRYAVIVPNADIVESLEDWGYGK